MASPSRNTYDVIIIGAGISGLVCGCYLAKAGMKVLIVEQHDKPGGYFTSFRRKGFLFDAAAHSFGNYREGGHVRKIFSDIGIEKIVRIERYDPSDVVITPDFTATFWNDKKNTIAGLSSLFPHEKENIQNFFNFLSASNQSEFTTLKNKTFEQLLHSYFHDEKLIATLAFPVFGNGGLPPSSMHAFSGAKIFSEFIIDGGYYPDGGMQQIPNALDRILKENGGEAVYKSLVKKIVQKNNTVAGIELDSHQPLSSKYVVSACDMSQTFRTFLRGDTVDKTVIDKLDTMVPSVSTFILYMGIDKPFQGCPEPGTNTWFLPHYDLDEIFKQTQQCNLNEAGIYMLRVSPDQKTINAFVCTPFQTDTYWKQNKKRVAEEFLSRIAKQLQNLKQHITYFEAATPSTLHRYTLNHQGAAFGWAKMPSQTFDPLLSKKTFLNGLYLAGHWTSIAFGMPGTCYSGYDTAKRILRKEEMTLP